VVWQAGQNAKIAAYDYMTGTRGEVKPLDFLGVGIQNTDPDDIEYVYTVASPYTYGTGLPEVTWKEA